MNVKILPCAWEGLARIKCRVRIDFGEDAALKVTDHILDTLERLERFPDSGVMTPDPWLNDMGFRMVISDRRNACVFRRVEDTVYVYIIADTRTEYTKVFMNRIITDPWIVTEEDSGTDRGG